MARTTFETPSAPQGLLETATQKPKLTLVVSPHGAIQTAEEELAFENRLRGMQPQQFGHNRQAATVSGAYHQSSTSALKQETSYLSGRITGPVQVFKAIVDMWNLNELQATRMLGFEDSELSYATSILHGDITLRGRDPKDRVSHLFVIRSSLASLFRDTQTENTWLREPQRDLENCTPLDFLVDGAFEKLLRVRHLVDVMSGRL